MSFIDSIPPSLPPSRLWPHLPGAVEDKSECEGVEGEEQDVYYLVAGQVCHCCGMSRLPSYCLLLVAIETSHMQGN